LTFSEKLSGTYEICPVCYWEDDAIQNNDFKYIGGANEVSLEQAKSNFKKYGAIESKFMKDVRGPLINEIKNS